MKAAGTTRQPARETLCTASAFGAGRRVRCRRWFGRLAAGGACLLALSSWLALPAPAQGLFPKGGRARQNIPTAPQPLSPATNPATASRDSAARRNAGSRRTLAPRPDTVQLPYNLVWGDTQGRLASLFAGVGAKISDKKTDGGKEVWTVQGLIAPNLQNSLFTFQQGQLAALEFDYNQSDWTTDKYNEQMGQFRRLLESKCEGPGELVSRGPTEPPAPDATVKETLTGYQWKHGDTVVQLFYFAAEDSAKNQNFRSISVHYHYQDPFAATDDTATAANGGGVPPPPGGEGTAPAAAATPQGNPLPFDPAHPAPGVTIAPPRGAKGDKTKPVPTTPENDPLPER